jgi:hypothetical protein
MWMLKPISNLAQMYVCYPRIVKRKEKLLRLEFVKTEKYHRRFHIMINTTTLETREQLTNEQVGVEQLPASLKRKLPATPFPRKFVLCVFLDIQEAMQAAFALSDAGFDSREIHILQSHEFVKSIMQDQSPFQIITSIDYDIYVREAHRGRFFLAVRPSNYGQLNQIRDLLALHHAFLANYIDTWTVTELLK